MWYKIPTQFSDLVAGVLYVGDDNNYGQYVQRMAAYNNLYFVYIPPDSSYPALRRVCKPDTYIYNWEQAGVLVNGKLAWTAQNQNSNPHAVWYDSTLSKYVYATGPAGRPLQVRQTGTANGSPVYVGDAWYQCTSEVSSAPFTQDSSYTFTPNGTTVASTAASVTLAFTVAQQWERSSALSYTDTGAPAGVYTPITATGAEDNTTVGCPVWRDTAGGQYIRSVYKDNNKYTYGAIRYSDGKWRLGALIGSQPSLSNAVTFSADGQTPVTVSLYAWRMDTQQEQPGQSFTANLVTMV